MDDKICITDGLQSVFLTYKVTYTVNLPDKISNQCRYQAFVPIKQAIKYIIQLLKTKALKIINVKL